MQNLEFRYGVLPTIVRAEASADTNLTEGVKASSYKACQAAQVKHRE